MALKTYNKLGEEVAQGAPGAAYQLDDSEKGHDKAVEVLKARAAKDPLFVTDVNAPGVPGIAHMAVEGFAVPISIADTKTPVEKLEEMRAGGLIADGPQVLTSEGMVPESSLAKPKPKPKEN